MKATDYYGTEVLIDTIAQINEILTSELNDPDNRLALSNSWHKAVMKAISCTQPILKKVRELTPKTCPFCSYDNANVVLVSNDYDEQSFAVICDVCLSSGPISNTPEEATKKWNQRH